MGVWGLGFISGFEVGFRVWGLKYHALRNLWVNPKREGEEEPSKEGGGGGNLPAFSASARSPKFGWVEGTRIETAHARTQTSSRCAAPHTSCEACHDPLRFRVRVQGFGWVWRANKSLSRAKKALLGVETLKPP